MKILCSWEKLQAAPSPALSFSGGGGTRWPSPRKMWERHPLPFSPPTPSHEKVMTTP